MINNRKSPIQDDYIEKYLAEKKLNLTATLDAKTAYADADFVVIAAPTNYDSHTQHFDTSAVEAVIKLVMEYIRMPSWSLNLQSLWDIWRLFVKSSMARASSSAQSFCLRARLSMITCILLVSSSALIYVMRD